MCECENCVENSSHYKFLKARGLDKLGMAAEAISPKFYAHLSKMFTAQVSGIIEGIKKDNGSLSVKDFAAIAFVAEKNAMGHADDVYINTMLNREIKAVEINEAVASALTLIQSKAVLSGDDAIADIAKNALETLKDNVMQSAAELKAMLDKTENQ
ncbi:hypothetical protein HX116_09860 [Acinetobacter towneri]|uniref:hypothetical protein n=1 Tax=Acinetobacter towneri TaxID=202956 RepID=UPI0025754623|nr:hypothetical protein [Acinetobacter towneri]MDM1731455.1 hypothetical protein [Acinetobacter towneri]MDM1734118.1 hypothetical protein [Acinetobacter towneri]MDM1739359.1 hypothetical protein [Acinetobacter towneri]MDM1742151.1 hypothetical protein [Acinetobacter towneri]MDM1744718.1 hypothetical protein [Acinetobacter towneri]